MLSLLIAMGAGAAAGAFIWRDQDAPAWGVVTFILTAIIVQIVMALVVRRRVGRIQRKMEDLMRAGQARINRQIAVFQARPGAGVKAAQQTLEKLQSDIVRDALALTAEYEPYYKWNLMLRKQINTMKMQLHYQLRDFAKVDELLPKCLVFDARSKLIKLIRMYKKDAPGLNKFYKSKCSRLKGDDGALAASTYAWILLKKGENEQAVAVMVAAKKLSDNPTLLENCDRLVNGKFKHFNNAGFGDLWYSLYLEEPKVKVQKQNRMY
ncbi:MAG: hypothetical protein PHI35_03785 [Victivallaceae bacterium]|nr:hypothetical protein [Victivallaceae bacterium]